MADTIQHRRGKKDDLPVLQTAEFGLCTDTKELFIGSSGENIPVLTLKKAAGGALGIDTEPITGSANLVSSGGVHAHVQVAVGNIEALLESI